MVIFFSVDVSRWWSPFQTVPSPSDRRECLSDIPGVFFFNLSISSYKTQTTSVCVSWSKPNDLSANSRMYPRLYRFPTIWSKGGGKKHDHIWIPSTFVLSHSDVCVCILIFFPPPSACQYAGVCLGYGKGLRQRDWQGLSELNCPPTSPPCVLCNYSGG